MLYQNGEVLGDPSLMSKRSERIERNVEGWKKFWWSIDNVRQTFNHYQPFPADAERMPKTFLGGILHPCEFPLKPISSEKLSQQLGSQAEQANPIVECESGKSMEMIKSG